MIEVNWQNIKSFIDSRGLSAQYVELDSRYIIQAHDNSFSLECVLDKSPTDSTDLNDFEANYKPSGNKKLSVRQAPFADKQDLFFRGKGVKQTITANSTASIIYTVPFPKGKVNGVEILYGNDKDTCNFKVLDDTSGTYTTVPNYLLNQFGYNWNVKASGIKEILAYDATLLLGMQLVIEYTNNSNTDTEVGVNFYIHEDKS